MKSSTTAYRDPSGPSWVMEEMRAVGTQSPSRRLRRSLTVLRRCTLILPFLCSAFAWAQRSQATPQRFQQDSASAIFQHLNEVSNGLANPVVSSFAEDGDGFLWVGTQSGLQRWDGYRFWSYKTKLGDASSLPDNLVQVLHTDSRGQLWIGTNSGGVARYDRAHDRFVRYQSDLSDPGRMTINAIAEDGDGGLWVGTDGGLDHLNTDTGKFRHVDLAAKDGENGQARRAISLVHSPDGTLWVGTEAGLERSIELGSGEPRMGEFRRVSLPAVKGASKLVQSLFRDHSGRIWVGTQFGAYVVEASSASLKNGDLAARAVIAKGQGSDLLGTQRNMSIAETTQGEIWLGTYDDGILAVTPSADGVWQVRRINHDVGLPTSISDDQLQALYLGRAGIMWAGTRRGINFIDTMPQTVFSLFGGTGHDSVIRDSDVYSVLARHDGSVWLGLGKRGVDILSATGQRIAQLPAQAESKVSGNSSTVLPFGTVSGLAQTSDGTVYICSQAGLFRVSAAYKPGVSSPQVTRIQMGTEHSPEATRVLSDAGVLWIGGSTGLWMLDPETSSGPAALAQMQQPLTDQRVTALFRGDGDSLWVGTENGLNRLDLKTRELEKILPDAADPLALGGGYISSMLTDGKGRLWVGTFTGGIDVMEGRDAQGRPRFHRIIEGLPNENIDMMLKAPDGNIWASTDGGVAEINPETFEIHVLRRAEGASITAHWNGAGAVDAGGDLLFGGLGGLTVVRPTMLKPWTYAPPVEVTSARIGSIELPTSRLNSGMNEYPIWIPSDRNNLTVEFSALDYSAPELNRYEYKLEGFDGDWIAADPTRRIARYTNVPPGNYVLQLRGSNRDGLWAPTRSVRILVLPAWNQTTWFRCLVVLGALLLLTGLFLLGTAYLRRQQRELERQVALRTAELRQMTVELQDSQQKLEHMAYRESLTGLPNRRMFTEHFRRLIALKRRQDGMFALLLLDFDDFKEINDTHGHDAGDAVLKEMALRMSAMVRESDCLARLGGDEFGLLLAESPDIEGTEMVCQKIIECFSEPVTFDGIELKTAISLGVALYPDDGDTQDKLYKAADLALYQAKRSGGNGCCWSDRASSTPQVQ